MGLVLQHGSNGRRRHTFGALCCSASGGVGGNAGQSNDENPSVEV